MTKSEYEQFTLGLFHLACDVGLRPACRELGISEDRGRQIAHRRKWNMAKLSPALNGRRMPDESPKITASMEIKRQILAKYSDRTMLGLARSACTASEHLSECQGSELIKPAAAIAAEQWSKVGDRTHGWTAGRQQGAQVAVQINIPMPTPEERAELNALDRKLDAIAAKLKAD